MPNNRFLADALRLRLCCVHRAAATLKGDPPHGRNRLVLPLRQVHGDTGTPEA
jgi:hypothetical protein